MTESKLNPSIGVKNFIINPGTGEVEDAREEYADENIVQLVQDVGLERITYRRDAPRDYGKGRFAYQLSDAQRDVEVQMPGWPLERVRYLGEKDQDMGNFPRLYVDGESWFWRFAVDMIKSKYESPEEE